MNWKSKIVNSDLEIHLYYLIPATYISIRSFHKFWLIPVHLYDVASKMQLTHKLIEFHALIEALYAIIGVISICFCLFFFLPFECIVLFFVLSSMNAVSHWITTLSTGAIDVDNIVEQFFTYSSNIVFNFQSSFIIHVEILFLIAELPHKRLLHKPGLEEVLERLRHRYSVPKHYQVIETRSPSDSMRYLIKYYYITK